MWTTEVKGPHYPGDVFILTSKQTFSAAEAFSYHLKHLGRVKTVGESTGGGAHRVRTENLLHGFKIVIPFTRPIHVITNSDWEGDGVQPDIIVSAEDALRAAKLAALRSLPTTPEREQLIEKLDK